MKDSTKRRLSYTSEYKEINTVTYTTPCNTKDGHIGHCGQQKYHIDIQTNLCLSWWYSFGHNNIQNLKEILSTLESEGRKIGLRINEKKTKYTKMSPTQVKNISKT